MARIKFHVRFNIELDDAGLREDDKLTSGAVARHVKDLEWSGGCQHPSFSLHSNRNIKVTQAKAHRLPKAPKKVTL